MPSPVFTIALMISTFSVSMTIVGSICSLAKNRSITRRVAEPDLEEHERLAREIARRHATPARQRMARRRHDQQLFAHDRNRHQIGLVDGQRQQPCIDAAGANLVHRLLGRRDPQPDVELRMNAPQIFEERREHIQADGHAARQPERAAQLARAIRDDADRFPDVLKDALAELNEAFGRRRHPNLPPDPEEQRLAELLFEQHDLPADGGLRHVELPAARGERPGLGNRLQDFELSQIHPASPR